MLFTLALRSLLAHPVRTAILAGGFGLGVAVMAILLGVGEVVLVQARSPQLMGGGDVLVTGSAGPIVAARVLLIGALKDGPRAAQVRAAAPWSRTTLFLSPLPDDSEGRDGRTFSVRARGGIPSLERALGDSETAGRSEWADTASDAAWASPDAGDVLRAIDRFHPIPDVPARAKSWAEWLYFNGRGPTARFYVTFMAGPSAGSATRSSSVRLQLERGGRTQSFRGTAALDEASVGAAPDLTIGRSSIRLDGLQYRIHLDLTGENGGHAAGDLTIEAAPGRLVPPVEIHGADGWRSGYVVPVISGALTGSLTVDGERIDFTGGTAYHDHNWGFWEGVTWQWGQVVHGDLAIVYGRVFPPRDAADPARMPGVLGVVGPSGVIGYATSLVIDESNDGSGQPKAITIRGRSTSMDLTLRFAVESMVTNRMASDPLTTQMDFMQLRGVYEASGRAGERTLDFRAPGSAETFRGR